LAPLFRFSNVISHYADFVTYTKLASNSYVKAKANFNNQCQRRNYNPHYVNNFNWAKKKKARCEKTATMPQDGRHLTSCADALPNLTLLSPDGESGDKLAVSVNVANCSMTRIQLCVEITVSNAYFFLGFPSLPATSTAQNSYNRFFANVAMLKYFGTADISKSD
jgi:hypothetical protein